MADMDADNFIEHQFKVGDILVPKFDRHKDLEHPLERKILKVYKGHYIWTYPYVTDGRDWDSANSSDPTLYYWKKKQLI